MVSLGTLVDKLTTTLPSTLRGQKTLSSSLTSLEPLSPILSVSKQLCVFELLEVSRGTLSIFRSAELIGEPPLLTGIRMSAFHGNFFVRSTDLLSLPAVPMDQSYAIEIQIEDPISAPFVVFQTAVLHTTCYGERRIRVVTLALPTTSSISELYASVDTVALATLLANKAVERSTQSKLEDARDAVSNKLVDVLGTYKATMTSAGSGASPQLVIAENMKFLPLLMLGLLKNVRNPFFFASSFLRLRLTTTRVTIDWSTKQHDDSFRREILRSSTPHYPSFSTFDPVPSPRLLLSTQHAERGTSLFSPLSSYRSR